MQQHVAGIQRLLTCPSGAVVAAAPARWLLSGELGATFSPHEVSSIIVRMTSMWSSPRRVQAVCLFA